MIPLDQYAMNEPTDPAEALAAALKANAPARVAQVLEHHPELKSRLLNDPLPGFAFGTTALLAAIPWGNRETIDLLLQAGADINARSHWWAGGFGVLDDDRGLAPFLIERGARVDAHAAARLGLLERLDELVSADPGLVQARGGDGQTPCTSPLTSRSPGTWWNAAPTSTRATSTMSPRRHNGWCATARRWRATWSRAEPGPTS